MPENHVPAPAVLNAVARSRPRATGYAATFGIIHQFMGATVEQYENTVKVAHPDGGKGLHPGQLSDVAGPTEGAFVVIALWDSEASWVSFRDGTLLPGLAKVDNGPPEPPQETTFRVHNSLPV